MDGSRRVAGCDVVCLLRRELRPEDCVEDGDMVVEDEAGEEEGV
jgi:hypothetical protein